MNKAHIVIHTHESSPGWLLKLTQANHLQPWRALCWRAVEDHRLTRADGRQKVSLTVVLGMILRLIGTNPPQEPLSAVFWLWKLS